MLVKWFVRCSDLLAPHIPACSAQLALCCVTQGFLHLSATSGLADGGFKRNGRSGAPAEEAGREVSC